MFSFITVCDETIPSSPRSRFYQYVYEFNQPSGFCLMIAFLISSYVKMNIDHGTAGNQCKMCNGRVPKTVFKAGVYTKVAPRTVSNNKPKFMKSFCKTCWKRESFLVLQINKSAHWTMMMEMKYAHCAYYKAELW